MKAREIADPGGVWDFLFSIYYLPLEWNASVLVIYFAVTGRVEFILDAGSSPA